MADWNGTARSNCFQVNDEAAFRAVAKQRDLHVFESVGGDHSPRRFGFYSKSPNPGRSSCPFRSGLQPQRLLSAGIRRQPMRDLRWEVQNFRDHGRLFLGACLWLILPDGGRICRRYYDGGEDLRLYPSALRAEEICAWQGRR